MEDFSAGSSSKKLKVSSPEKDEVILKIAVVKGDIETLKNKLKEKPDFVNISLNEHKETLLHWCEDTRVAQFLVENGTKVNAQDKYGQSPLCCAVAKNNLSLVRFLLSSGADANIKMLRGNTPLHYARTEDIIKVLLSHGANVNESNDYGFTPIFSALLEKRGFPVVKLLLDHGADVHSTDMTGNTLLHCCDSSYIVREFVSRGVEVNKTNNNGHTPLSSAIMIKDKETALIRELLERGADVNHSESAKLAARELAENAPFDAPMDVLLLLITFGADYRMGQFNLCDRFKRHVQLQIAKMIMLRDGGVTAFINEVNIINIKELKYYRYICISQINDMKSDILGRDLTMFDILTMRVDNRKEIARSPEELHHISLCKYGFYKDVLAPKLQMSLEWSRLLREMRMMMLYAEGTESSKRIYLHQYCADALVKNLSDGDLTNLIAALE